MKDLFHPLTIFDFGAGPVLAAGGDGVPPLFALLAVMLVSVVLLSLLMLRVQRSLLVGYFLCGVVIANSGIIEWLGGGESHEMVRQMAEFGVMLLMFVLGLEFSISELKFLRRFALTGGGLQMAICAGFVLAIAKFSGLSWPAATVLGVALGMSSTAVSLKSFQDMDLSASPGARLALGVAIFQDLFIIAFLVFLPLLLQHGSGDRRLTLEIAMLVGRGTAFVILAWACARWIFPWLLHSVARTRQRELFTLTVVACCVALAYVGGLLQLSLALGAFVAGLAVSESIYKHRILADIMPIKDVFLTLFFVSVGLLIDLPVAADHWAAILGIAVGLLVFKSIVITGIALMLGQVTKSALLAGISLASAGEFSLLLVAKASKASLFDPAFTQVLFASTTLGMAILPALMRFADPFAQFLESIGWVRRRVRPPFPEETTLRQRVDQLSRHAVICGYGPVGRALNRGLLGLGYQTLVIELNADTVRSLLKEGQPVLFADVRDPETWDLARLKEATLVAFTFPDASTSGTAIRHVREHNPEVAILARSRFASDHSRLERIGVTSVLHDEFEVGSAVVDSALKLLEEPPAAPDT